MGWLDGGRTNKCAGDWSLVPQPTTWTPSVLRSNNCSNKTKTIFNKSLSGQSIRYCHHLPHPVSTGPTLVPVVVFWTGILHALLHKSFLYSPNASNFRHTMTTTAFYCPRSSNITTAVLYLFHPPPVHGQGVWNRSRFSFSAQSSVWANWTASVRKSTINVFKCHHINKQCGNGEFRRWSRSRRCGRGRAARSWRTTSFTSSFEYCSGVLYFNALHIAIEYCTRSLYVLFAQRSVIGIPTTESIDRDMEQEDSV